MSMEPLGPRPPRRDPDMALHLAIASHQSNGWRVESMTNRSAVVATGSECNHILHLLLTIFSCGLWFPLWLVLAMTQKVQRATITVNEEGQVFYAKGEGSR